MADICFFEKRPLSIAALNAELSTLNCDITPSIVNLSGRVNPVFSRRDSVNTLLVPQR